MEEGWAVSSRRLPRGSGTVITCGRCKATSTTGQVIIGFHRAWLRSTQNWGQATAPWIDGRPRKGDDLCPACVGQDLEDASWHEFMKQRIAERRARR